MAIGRFHEHATILMAQPASYDVIGNQQLNRIRAKKVPQVVMPEMLAVRNPYGLAGRFKDFLGRQDVENRTVDLALVLGKGFEQFTNRREKRDAALRVILGSGFPSRHEYRAFLKIDMLPQHVAGFVDTQSCIREEANEYTGITAAIRFVQSLACIDGGEPTP